MKRLILPAILMLSFASAGKLVSESANAKAVNTSTAILAGGCFWSMEKAFEGLPGVLDVVSGFSGGNTKNPSYEQVSTGKTGHLESIRITYDPAKISYAKLLDHYWHHIDPTVKNRQFCDAGSEYQTAIFYSSADEKNVAEQTKAEVATALKKPVATEIRAAASFYPAEDYHQDYAAKNPIPYNSYRIGCGRDKALSAIWGK